ncbi:MAG: peptide chain release factor 2 [Bacilli bacterium]
MIDIGLLKAELNDLAVLIQQVSESLDLAQLKQSILDDEALMDGPHFWDHQRQAKAVIQRLNEKKFFVESLDKLKQTHHDLLELLPLIEADESLFQGFQSELTQVKTLGKQVQEQILFSGEFDSLNAIVEIHPGAGGTESHDWANMLYRMYVRYAEANRMQVQMLDYLAGEEAGIKSVTMLIKGARAYGLLKSEKGVHRLVRISPFDANGRRHTSFASVNVIPEIVDEVDIDVQEKDLRIDTYRSGGAGGQNVNKVESAVRITHIPTGLVAACQIERSQLQNKEKAMQMLKAQLYQLKKQQQEAHLDAIVGEQKDIEWGSQIRSYVFQPYMLIKDHRTDYQEGDVNKVMDGTIDGFIRAYLEMEAKKHAKK